MNAKPKASAPRTVQFAAAFLMMLQAVVLAGCEPWTIRSISDAKSTQTNDPASYVDSIWNSKLVPQILNSAVDARTLLSAMSSSMDDARQEYGRNVGGEWYFIVKGQGNVSAVDTSSRSGVLSLTISPKNERPDVSIQLGPILRGTALRDSTGLISFTNFVNQLDFADVAKDLNEKAGKTVLSLFHTNDLVGQTIQFAGAFEQDSAVSQPPIKDVVPVDLTLVKTQ
jgi:predicted lipoprotein